MDIQGITKEEAYRMIRIPTGNHFLYLGIECLINDEPALVVREHIMRDWRKPMYSRLQLSALLDNTSKVESLPLRNWHHSPYDSFETEKLIERAARKDHGK